MKIYGIHEDSFWKGEVRVEARAEDNHREYRVRAWLREQGLYDWSCSCPEGERKILPCAHVNALLLAYRKKEREEKKVPVSTSGAVRTLVREYTNREVARILGEDPEMKVTIYPRLLFRDTAVFLECRVGTEGHSCLIPNLADFADAVKCGRLVEYRRGFAFEHTETVFEEKVRPLLRLLLEEISSYLHYRGEARGNVQAGVFRELPLSPAALDRFISLMSGESLQASDSFGDIGPLEVVEKNPAFTVTARRLGPDGIEVELPTGLSAFSGEKRLYVVWNRKLFCCTAEFSAEIGPFLREAFAGAEKRKKEDSRAFALVLRVNRRDLPLFYTRVLSVLLKQGLLESDNIDWEEIQPPRLKAVFFFSGEGPSRVRMLPTLSYGEYSFHPFKDENIPRDICRDVPAEFRVNRVLRRYFGGDVLPDGSLLAEGTDTIYRLLSEGMDHFRELGEVRVDESLGNMRVTAPPAMHFGVSLNSGWLTLEVDTGDLSAEEIRGILKDYRKKIPYYKRKDGSFLSLEGDSLKALSQLTEDLELGREFFETRRAAVPAFRAWYLDSLLRENGEIRFSRDERFREMIQDLRAGEDPEAQLPGRLEPVLREYQKTGFYWMEILDRYGFGGILADDMGLGKTLQMIALVLFEKQRREKEGKKPLPSLVICPASLVYNWEHEIREFAPELRAIAVTGNAETRRSLISGAKDADVLVTSYDLLKRDIAAYEGLTFRFEVLDEAQYIKNARTKNAGAVKAVSSLSRFALTGTPVENRLSELWSVFDFLMPGFLGSYRKFKTGYEVPVMRGEDPEVALRLRRLIHPFVLRRLKSDVLKELPEKLEKVVYSAAEEKQDKLYRVEAGALRKRLEEGAGENDRFEILSRLMRLRQICCDPSLCYEDYRDGSAKLETCISLVRSAVEAGHKILLFSQFASMLEIIRRRLDKEEIATYLLTGQTPAEERSRTVTSFLEDEVPVYLISLKAGGTGLNLTSADIVIHYDPWWNLAAQNQATDRAHRIGQKRQVIVYRLIMKNTIEENIIRLQNSKQLLADSVVGEVSPGAGMPGKEELLRILSGEEENEGLIAPGDIGSEPNKHEI